MRAPPWHLASHSRCVTFGDDATPIGACERQIGAAGGLRVVVVRVVPRPRGRLSKKSQGASSRRQINVVAILAVSRNASYAGGLREGEVASGGAACPADTVSLAFAYLQLSGRAQGPGNNK